LPEREVVVPGQLDDLLCVGAEPPLGHVQDVGERRVEVVLPEVVPGERAAELGQRAVEVLVGQLQLALDLPGLRVGITHEHRDARHHHDVVGVAALGRGPGLDVAVEGLPGLDRRGMGEDPLTDGRAEVTALLGVAGLEDDRLSLR